MKRILMACLLSLCVLNAGLVFAETDYSAKVGGVAVNFPTPSDEFEEVGYDNRELMEILVPPTNRLICAFLTKEDLAKFGTEDAGPLSRYMMIQVARQGEYVDLTASEFTELLVDIEAEMDSIMPDAVDEVNEDMARRLKDLTDEEITVGQPEMLGKLFEKPNASSLAMVMPIQEGETTTKMLCSVSFLRLKSKILFAYVYSEYTGEDAFEWVKSTTQQWVDSLLTANQ